MGTETMTPVDATHVGPGGQVYRVDQYGAAWKWGGVNWHLLRDLPLQAVEIKREWNGEGLPPVGALVEDRSTLGAPVYIAEVVAVEDVLVAIKRPGSLKVVDVHALRPLCIADLEREAAILTLASDAGSPIPNASQRAVAERLIDAGWIKRS